MIDDMIESICKVGEPLTSFVENNWIKIVVFIVLVPIVLLGWFLGKKLGLY